MFTPQYYPSNQPLIHGFMQPVPVHPSGDQGRKHDLSTSMGIEQDQIEKRVRHHTTDLSSIGRLDMSDIETGTITLSDTMEQLKKSFYKRGHCTD